MANIAIEFPSFKKTNHMKKSTVLLLTSILVVSVAFAQDASKLCRAPNPAMSIDLRNENMLNQPTVVNYHHVSINNAGTRDVTGVEIGTSANGLTVLNNATNCVMANSDLGTVAFIHRNDPSATGFGTSSQFNFDASTDGGMTWTINYGPLNPNTDGSGVGGINGRYPQAVFFNPSGATTADSIYLAYLGTWHNGSSNFNTWDGAIHGVGRVDGTTGTFTEGDDSVNHGNVGIFTSMCESTPGTFWTVTPAWDGDDLAGYPNDSNYVVLKGIWNATTRDIDWSISTIINLPPDLGFDGNTYAVDPLIAFDPTGEKGWIVIDGDFINDGIYVYQPVFFNTTDGGTTWSVPEFLDLSQFDNILTTLDPSGSGIPTTAFDVNLAVDANGNPHFVSVIGSGSDNGIEGYTHVIFDIVHFGDTWQAIQLGDAGQSFRGYVGSGAAGDYTEDNRVRISRTPDGSKMYVTWIATDSTLFDQTYSNSYPNMFGAGIDANLHTTPVKNITGGTNFDALAYMPHTAPICMRNSSNDASIIPTVVIQVNSSGAFDTAPATFFYLNGVQFDDSEFPFNSVPTVNTPEFEVSQNYPNPFNDRTQFKITVPNQSNVTVKVTNILGQEVYSTSLNYAAGTHFFTLNKENLSSGIYNFSVIANGKQITKKITVD